MEIVTSQGSGGQCQIAILKQCRSLTFPTVVSPLFVTFQIIIHYFQTVLSLFMSIQMKYEVCLYVSAFLQLSHAQSEVDSPSGSFGFTSNTLLTFRFIASHFIWLYISSSISVVSHSQPYYNVRLLKTHIICSRTFIMISIILDLVAGSCILFSSFHTHSHSILIHFTGTQAPRKFVRVEIFSSWINSRGNSEDPELAS